MLIVYPCSKVFLKGHASVQGSTHQHVSSQPHKCDLWSTQCVRKTMTIVVKQPLYADSVETNDSMSGGHGCAKKMASATPVDPMIALRQEIDIMRLLRHPNIVALHEVRTHMERACLLQCGQTYSPECPRRGESSGYSI